MPMLKALGANIDLTVTGPLTGVTLGETPFFPGNNAILRLSSAIGGAGAIQIQGSDALAGTYTTLQTINAASGLDIEVFNLPAFIRLNKSVAGTGTIANAVLEGVQ
ncbi:MAG: hypothetical protein ACREO8_06570 [Luteimonas sp.]